MTKPDRYPVTATRFPWYVDAPLWIVGTLNAMSGNRLFTGPRTEAFILWTARRFYQCRIDGRWYWLSDIRAPETLR